MNDYKKLVTRRNLLQTFACIMIAPLQAEEKATTSRLPGTKGELFRIRALDRKYDLHRENGCTLLAICLLYTSPSPRDGLLSRMPSSA